MNNFRRKNDEIASSACLKPDASPSKILHVGTPRAIWRYMLWWSGWAQIRPNRPQTPEKLRAFGAIHHTKPSKREKIPPRLERQTSHNPPNARWIPHVWSTTQPQSSHYKRSLTKLALEVHWTSNLSEFPLRIAFSRYALSEKAGRRANARKLPRIWSTKVAQTLQTRDETLTFGAPHCAALPTHYHIIRLLVY